nr:hypothetical protein [Tanacetum cinerariifolium]
IQAHLILGSKVQVLTAVDLYVLIEDVFLLIGFVVLGENGKGEADLGVGSESIIGGWVEYLSTEVTRDLFLVRVDQERIVNRVPTSSHRVFLLQSRAMKLHKLFQLAYDVHTCRMIPRLVIILEGDMYISGGPKEDEYIMSYQSQGVPVWEGAEVVHQQAG